ncbi:MAG TPA: 1-phosphofructokinase family hexose kinase [Chloroflexia bacterium]|nr:1-phosphofructokinase family hexose kinase [Chloroflexia bacterium]
MILCVNANAAIDKTVVVSNFRLGQIHRPESVLAVPGGKGANLAKGLTLLGGDPLVTGWVGGSSGDFIEQGLERMGMKTAFVHLESESRTCLSILDPTTGHMTEIYERGEPVPPDKVEELVDVFGQHVGTCEAVTMSGSLPAGVPPDFYARLIEIAHAANVPVYLDSSGEALRLGVAARPYLTKPNAHEFAELAGGDAHSAHTLAHAAAEVSRRYGTIVVISLGADGVLVAGGRKTFAVHPPRIEVKSAVGSGDCLLAGIAYGMTHGFTLAEAARYGVAAGTANALSVGPGVFDLADFRRILAQVEIM